MPWRNRPSLDKTKSRESLLFAEIREAGFRKARDAGVPRAVCSTWHNVLYCTYIIMGRRPTLERRNYETRRQELNLIFEGSESGRIEDFEWAGCLLSGYSSLSLERESPGALDVWPFGGQ